MNKNAIGYVRISNSDQSNFSLDGQEKYITDFCENHHYNLLQIFKDDGKSAKNFDRPDWKLLEIFIKNNPQVSFLVVVKYDRFSRNVSQSLAKIDLLEKKYQIIPTGEQLRIRARCLTREESDLLLDTENAPVLDVSGIGLNQETQPIWYQNLLYRADRYELMNTVHNFGPGCQSNTSLQPQQPNKKNE